MHLNSPQLFLVAMPLGNPGDCSPRAREVLSNADVVLAEDTRRSGRLFAALGIKARRFLSFQEHNEADRLPLVFEMFNQGLTLVLISDAGMPLLADPGYRLVRACREAGIDVSVIPGPSAGITALAGSGLAPLPHVFLGFLPRKQSDQRVLFTRFSSAGCTLVFYERKNRLAASLGVARQVLGKRECCVARELTKTFEEYISFTLDTVPPLDHLLGEITVIIGPGMPENDVQSGDSGGGETLVSLIVQAREEMPHARPREIARLVKERSQGISMKSIYAMMAEEKG